MQVPVAVKTLNPSHLVTGKNEFLGEAKVMVQLDHPCIVKLIGICQEPQLMLVSRKSILRTISDSVGQYVPRVTHKLGNLLTWKKIEKSFLILGYTGFPEYFLCICVFLMLGIPVQNTFFLLYYYKGITLVFISVAKENAVSEYFLFVLVYVQLAPALQ